MLNQVYFYSGLYDIQPIIGDLLFWLMCSDSRDVMRAKLAEYEATRHSYPKDTWDVEAQGPLIDLSQACLNVLAVGQQPVSGAYALRHPRALQVKRRK